MFRNLRIKSKLMLVMLVTSGIALVLSAGAFVAYELLTFPETVSETATTLAQVVAYNSTASLAFNNEADATQVLSALRAEKQVAASALYDKKGNLFAWYPKTEPKNSFPPTAGPTGIDRKTSHWTVFAPVVESGTRMGTVYVKMDLSLMQMRLRSFGLIAVVVMISSFAVTLTIATAFQKQISVPIVSLANTATVVSEREDYSVRAEKYSNDELGVLTDAFNRMLGQIQERDIALRSTADDLVRSNSELEQFAYVASHDLQEPLRAVGGCVQLLKRRYQSQLDATAEELIGHTVEGVTRMQTLINDLLAYSRVGTRGTPFEPTNCSVILKHALDNLQAAIEESGAVVTSDPLPTVNADSTQMTQLLQNLVGNAIKYRDHRRPEIHVGVKSEDNNWVFSVADNGIGIEPQYYERVFKVFQRLHQRREYSGNGIGLAICKKIVERHGGQIWVESKLGEGSTFYFRISKAGVEEHVYV
jgi:signal transduction histidine kinase